MSRIGKEPVKLADGVTATVAGQTVTVKGKLGELSYTMHEGITAQVENRKFSVFSMQTASVRQLKSVERNIRLFLTFRIISHQQIKLFRQLSS